MTEDQKKFAIAALRRASYRWPSRNEAFKAARTGRNKYKCAKCHGNTRHPRKNIQLDHINPIVNPLTGWTNFDSYIERLLVDLSGWQVLCREHHLEKTKEEAAQRKMTRDIQKALKSKK